MVTKGDATRLRVLDEAVRQVGAKGLMGVSLGDLAEGSGLSKSGLFKHFDSKDDMQMAVLEHILSRFVDKVWKPALDHPSGRKRLEELFDRWLDWAEVDHNAYGCPVMQVSSELDDRPGPLRDRLQSGLQRWTTFLVGEFQALRDPPVDAGQAALAAFQMKSFILGHNEARRLLEEKGARAAANAAFASLLDRTAQGS